MKKHYYSLLIMLCMIFSLNCYSQTPLSRQKSKPLGSTSLNYGFLEYVPSNYNSVSQHPVVIFLHGIGEAGDGNINLVRLAKHGPFKLIKEGWDLPYIAFAPQEAAGLWQDSIAIRSIIRWVIGNYKVDPKRVYVTGLSAGGWGSWRAGAITPELVTAIVPISGCGNVTQAAKLKPVPVWAFHNSGDQSVPPQCDKDMVNAVNAAGGNAKLTLYPVAGHDAFTTTYYDQNMWNWLLAQSKTTVVIVNKYPVVNAGADKTITLPTNSTTFTATASDANGTIASYLWKKLSGPSAYLPPNPTNPTVTVSSLVAGTYVFRVSVKDNSGATTVDDVKLVVNPASSTNILPTVNAGPDKVITLPTNSLTLTATASDQDGTITYTLWTKISGPTCTMTNASQKTMQLSNLLAGVYVFRMTVKDNLGASKYDEAKVTVNPAAARLGEKETTTSGFDLYPSLGDAKFNLNINSIEPSNAHVTVLNSKGVILSDEHIEIQDGASTELDIAHLPADVYFVKISAGDKQETLRFIKY